MAKIQTRKWDAAEHLKTEEDMAAYLEAAPSIKNVLNEISAIIIQNKK